MPGEIDPLVEFSVSRIAKVLVDKPDGFPDEAQVGQGTIGAMAVGADVDTAVKVNIALHRDPNIEKQIGNSKYLAGALFYLTLKELEEA